MSKQYSPEELAQAIREKLLETLKKSEDKGNDQSIERIHLPVKEEARKVKENADGMPEAVGDKLEKARVDEGLKPGDKKFVREERKKAPYSEKGIHLAIRGMTHERAKEIGSDAKEQSLAGVRVRRGDIEGAKQEVKSNLKEMLEKARVDEGKSLQDKIDARQRRNHREVKETRTPTGQKTRTFKTHFNRASDLEDSSAPRRHGEKIIGQARETNEATSGVHVRQATYAPKERNKMGTGAMSEKGGAKSYRSGGSYHVPGGDRMAHEDVMKKLGKLKNKDRSGMGKSELEKTNPMNRNEAQIAGIKMPQPAAPKAVDKIITNTASKEIKPPKTPSLGVGLKKFMEERGEKLEKARVDEGKWDAQKRAARVDSSGTHRSGIKNAMDTSQGVHVKSGRLGRAKDIAKENLQRIKDAPKPKLGKSEPCAKDCKKNHEHVRDE